MSFKDKLAQWNARDSKTESNFLDIVRLASKNNDFVRLGAKKRISVAKRDASTSISKKADDTDQHQHQKAQNQNTLSSSPSSSSNAKKTDSLVNVILEQNAINSSSTSVRDSISNLEAGGHSLKSTKYRVRVKTTQKSKKTRTKSVKAKPLQELRKQFTPPIVEKNVTDQELIREALNKNFIFQKLVESSLEQLIQAFEPTSTYSSPDVIIKQGDEGDFFYIIGSGTVDYEVGGNKVGSASKGASFGELSLLYTCPRAATVRTTSSTKLFRVDQTTFRYILQNQTKQSKAQKLKLLKVIDFFQQMVTSDLMHVCSVMTPRRYKAGDVIIKKGDEGNAFYIVQDGQLKVTEISAGNAIYEDVTLGPGDYFGERALVKSEPRAANVIGVAPGTLWVLSRATFEKVCGTFVRLILKSQDKRRLDGVKVIKAAELDSASLEDLSQYLADEIYGEGKELFIQGKETNPALYLVREGRIEITYTNGEERVIKEGGYFGEEQLLADAMRQDCASNASPTTVAKYSAVALENNSICGVLTLVDCRKVFDTKALDVGSEMDDELFADVANEAEDDFGGIVGRRSSRRGSIDMDNLRDSLQRDSVLGEGQFGEVWQVSTTHFENMNDSFALKIQSKSDTSRATYSASEAIARECNILSDLDHPFIVDLVHHYEDNDSHFMVMGLIKGGDLWSVIHKEDEDGNWNSGIPEAHAKFYALVIADTLDYIHRQTICFRDMKPENVMVDESGYPIIVDFGFAKYLKEGTTYTFCGTPNYLAPEIISNQGHNYAVDHWALAVLIYEMICGENPFHYDGIDQLTLFNDICNEEAYPLSKEVSPECKHLIDRMLVKDPTRRVGSLAKGGNEIKMDPWFEDISIAQVRQKAYPAPFIPQQ